MAGGISQEVGGVGNHQVTRQYMAVEGAGGAPWGG